jgi:hypothetical protein
MAKRTPEQNKEIYRRRVERAKAEGYAGYGQKRYRQQKQTKLQEIQTRFETELEKQFPGIVTADQLDLPPDREYAYERLLNSGKFTEEELQMLRAAAFDEFWQIARPMLNRLSP